MCDGGGGWVDGWVGALDVVHVNDLIGVGGLVGD